MATQIYFGAPVAFGDDHPLDGRERRSNQVRGTTIGEIAARCNTDIESYAAIINKYGSRGLHGRPLSFSKDWAPSPGLENPFRVTSPPYPENGPRQSKPMREFDTTSDPDAAEEAERKRKFPLAQIGPARAGVVFPNGRRI